jgi:hypothetical protein
VVQAGWSFKLVGRSSWLVVQAAWWFKLAVRSTAGANQLHHVVLNFHRLENQPATY